MKKVYLLVFFLFFSTAYAQTSPVLKRIDRNAALSGALQNNPSYMAAMEDNKSAQYSYYASWGEFLPYVNAEYGASNTNADSFSRRNTTELTAGINLFSGGSSYSRMQEQKYRMQGFAQAEKQSYLALVRDVNIAYQAALRADYLRRSTKTMFESAELLLKEAETRLELDIITRAELYRAKADREKAYNSLLDAEVAYRQALLEISKLSGLNVDDTTELAQEERSYILAPLEDYIQAAQNASTAIKISETDVQAARYVYKSRLGTFLPSVDATAGTGWYEERERDYNSHSIGITARWNLFTGFSDRNMALAASKSLNSARFNLASQRNEVIKQVKSAWLEAKASADRLISAEIYVQAAQESYSATQEMFRLGRATLKDTVDERAVLEDAQASLADAKYIMVQRYEELIFLTGGL